MSRTAIVVGVAGAVGEASALALRRKGWRVVGTMRRDRSGAAARLKAAGVEIATLDMRDTTLLAAMAKDANALVFTPHLTLLIPALPLAVSKRVVAFSSNNIAVAPDAPSYRELALAEAALRAAHPSALIIRPTMIYGDPRLETLTRLVRLARKWPIFPMVGDGKARMQPVFHADLGYLVAGLLDEAPAGGAFAAGGPEILPMVELYQAICKSAGTAPLILPVPALALRAASRLGIPIPLSAEQIERADLDRVAIAQDPIPLKLAPQTPLAIGLEALARQLR
jgi:NADH dehydrogenase